MPDTGTQLAGSELIPSAVIDKPPSAELRPDQKDTDTLPPYELLDPVLKAYVEEDKSVEQIIALGIDERWSRGPPDWWMAASTSAGRRRRGSR